MNEIQTSGRWEEERLWILRSIEELKRDFRQQAEQAAVTRQTIVEKAQRDIGVAHDRIRKLEGAKLSLTIKTWALAAALGGIFTVAVELFKLAHK